jgi:hypothetical protein
MANLTFTAGEPIYRGNVVAVSSGNGAVYKVSSSNFLCNSIVGFAAADASTGSLVQVNNDKIVNTLSGLTPGSTAYVSYASGSVVSSYLGWFNSIPIDATGTLYLTTVGRSVSSSGVSNQIEPPAAVNLDDIFVYFLLEDTSGYIADEDGGIISLEH